MQMVVEITGGVGSSKRSIPMYVEVKDTFLGLGNSPPWVSGVCAYLESRGTDGLCSRLFFQLIYS